MGCSYGKAAAPTRDGAGTGYEAGDGDGDGTPALRFEEAVCGVYDGARIVSVYDGDSFRVVFPFRGVETEWRCRLEGVDTPELKPPKAMPDRAVEVARAVAARDFVRGWAEDPAGLSVRVTGVEKYGRLLCQLWRGEESLAERLIREGHAYSYDGGSKEAAKSRAAAARGGKGEGVGEG